MSTKNVVIALCHERGTKKKFKARRESNSITELFGDSWRAKSYLLGSL